MRAEPPWLAVLAAILAACSIHGSLGVGVSSEGVSLESGMLHVSSFDDDDSRAKRVANWLWPKVVTTCGESSLARITSGNGDELRLLEYFRPTFYSTGYHVADTADGEWRGYTIMRAGFMRSQRADGSWSGWTRAGEVLKLPLKVAAAEWDWSEALAALKSAGFVSPPDCATLPQRPEVVPPQ